MANDITITVDAVNYVFKEVIGAPKGQILRADLTNGTNAAPRKMFTGFTPGNGNRPDRSLFKLETNEVDSTDASKSALYSLHVVGARPRVSYVSDAEMILLKDQLVEYISDDTRFINWLKGSM